MDANTPADVAPFWARVLRRELSYQDSGDAVLTGQTKEHGVWIDTVPEAKSGKNRVHLDLVRDSYAPMTDAGAKVLQQPEPGRAWAVLADPAGNEFCVFPAGDGSPEALVIDAGDPVGMAAWWADVLGARTVQAPEGAPRWVSGIDAFPYDVWKFVAVPEPKMAKNRWHWDVVCDDIDALVARGARVLRVPDGDVSWHVLADPEGNEFCAFASDA